MRGIWGKIIPILIATTLLIAVPTSSISLDSELRDLLQDIDDNTDGIEGLLITLDGKILIGELTTSDLQTGDAAVKASAGWLGGFLIITDGTNDGTLILYDDPDSADGTVLAKWVVAGGDNCGGVMFPFPVEATTGIYGDISGIGANWIAYYQ